MRIGMVETVAENHLQKHIRAAASQFVGTLETRQGVKIACLEEIALTQGFIDADSFARMAASAPASDYGRYLRALLSDLEWDSGSATPLRAVAG